MKKSITTYLWLCLLGVLIVGGVAPLRAQTNKIVFQTSRLAGETVYFDIAANGDISMTGVEEAAVVGSNTYTLTSSTVTIEGEITSFDCYDTQATKLDLSACNTLESLYCWFNELTELDVSQNKNLTKLYCDYNQLQSLNVSENTLLSVLVCEKNLLTTLDVSQSSKLKQINCKNNQLSSLTMPSSDVLEKVTCSGNKLQGEQMTALVNALPDRTGGYSGELFVFNPEGDENVILKSDVAIAKQKHWDVLDEDYADYEGIDEPTPAANQITMTTTLPIGDKIYLTCEAEGDVTFEGIDVSMLPQDPAKGYTLMAQTVTIKGDVRNLQCSENELTSLDVTQNSVLQNLNCAGNKLTSIDLTKNGNLKEFTCQANQLTELDLSQNPELVKCNFANNQIKSVNLGTLSKLEELTCQMNALTALDLSQCIALQSLYCPDNQISTLDLSNNPNLVILFVPNNPFSAGLNLSQNSKLEVLHCNKSSLSELDITNNPLLREVVCWGNNLSQLDVSKNVNLSNLHCSENQLTALDVSKNSNLIQLYCQNNQIEVLDVSQNLALEGLECFNNQISTLDLSNNKALQWLYCSENKIISLKVAANGVLEEIDCFKNQIKGEEMTTFVNSLPDRTGGKEGEIRIVAEKDELNVCLKSDVQIAKQKNWGVKTDDWNDYPGSSTHIDAVLNDATIAVYPNPATDEIRIKGADANQKVILYATDGTLVKTSYTDLNGSCIMTLEDCAAGQYLLSISNGTITWWQVVMVQ